MEKYLLSEQELTLLRQEHRLCKVKRDADKIKAVYHLGCGWRIKEVAKALLLDEDTVTSYFRKYKVGGIYGLLKDNYVGGKGYLSVQELLMIDEHIQNNFFRTAKQIMEYIKKTTNVRYCISGVTRLMKSLSYIYRRVMRMPGKFSAERQTEFIDSYYKLMKNKDKSPVIFIDSAHPQHNVANQCGWMKKHIQWVINSNTGRKRLNIHGALNIESKDIIVLFEKKIDKYAVIRMLSKIEDKYSEDNCIYLICDNAPYYHAGIVKKYLEKSRIKMIFLPTYSPNLNIIERLWRFFKERVLTTYYETFGEFKFSCESFFENIHLYKEELKTLLTDNFQTYT